MYVEAEEGALYPISRGLRDWGGAVTDGSVRLYGNPALVKALPRWFLSHSASVGGLTAIR